MRRIPETIPNWFMETRRPRISAGAISAIYIGASIDATPIPIPPIKRKKTNHVKSSGTIIPADETANKIPDSTKTFLRPILSLNAPAKVAPITQPMSAHEAIHPFMVGESEYAFSMKPIAPATTAVSYPNKSPPTAATIVALYTYHLFPLLIIYFS